MHNHRAVPSLLGLISLLTITLLLFLPHAILSTNDDETTTSHVHRNLRLINRVNQSGAKWFASSNKFTRGEREPSIYRPSALLNRVEFRSEFSERHYEKLKQLVRRGMKGEHGMELIVGGDDDQFDSRNKWPLCIHPIRDQQDCGSCYSFASSEVMSDRFCIFSNTSINPILAPQDLISCSYYTFGCDGGIPSWTFDYILHDGLVTEQCLPYQSGQGHVPKCPRNCQNNQSVPLSADKHFADRYYHVAEFVEGKEERVRQIKEEVVRNGPVNADFIVYEDFMNYQSGVYHHVSGGFKGIHAVKIIGWGVENNTPYWLVANSWGTDWGLNGFFKILRGVDMVGIEFSVYAGIPKL